MNSVEASEKLWKALLSACEYIRDGISKQLTSATSFGGNDFTEIKTAFLTLRETEPYLTRELIDSANNALVAAQNELNIFLDKLRVVVAMSGQSRSEAVKNANRQLAIALNKYEDKLQEVKKYLIKGETYLNSQNIVIHGNVENFAGGAIGQINQNISLHTILSEIEKSSASNQDKEHAKSLLKNFLMHPLVAAIAGGISGRGGG